MGKKLAVPGVMVFVVACYASVASAQVVRIAPIVLQTATPGGSERFASALPPASDARIDPASTFFIEIWASNSGAPLDGLACVHLDVSYDRTDVMDSVPPVINGAFLPNNVVSVVFDDPSGLVGDSGGCQTIPTVNLLGVGEWVLIERIEFVATGLATGINVAVADANNPFAGSSIIGQLNNVDPLDIDFQVRSFDISGECTLDAECDDLNPCTDDTCVATTCFNTNNDANDPTDGLFCNGAETCVAGVITPGTPPVCDDLDPCTDDACDDVLGCQTTFNTAPCDNGDPCTSGDACSAGSCVAGTAVDCSALDDGCNVGTCNLSTGACITLPVNNGSACNDGDVCTLGDTCVFGNCIGSPDPACAPSITMTADVGGLPIDTCYGLADIFTVRIDKAASAVPIVGGQFFLEYDPASLSVVSIAPGDPPFTFEIAEIVDPIAGTIDYAVGVPSQNPGTTAQTLMAEITFQAIAECDSFVRFRTNTPPTVLTDDTGTARVPGITELPPITINASPPVLTCPQDVSLHADSGSVVAQVIFSQIPATDSCDGVVPVTCVSAPLPGLEGGGAFPPGTTTITCQATNSCGVLGQCSFDVTVSQSNELFVDIELSPTLVPGPVTRCITFELHRCGFAAQSITQEIDFGGQFSIPGRAENVSVLIPAGPWECVTARDALHTLESTATNFADNGTTFSASFMGNPALGGHWLTGGNLNDDDFIDILDFAVWNASFGLADPNTDCLTLAPHADVNGDGLVNIFDFTFIQQNFFDESDDSCCIAPSSAGRLSGPRDEISVRELHAIGLGHLSGADLNHDGVVDLDDVALAGTQQEPSNDSSKTGRSGRSTRLRR